ncbi:MAG TPA: response regulator [Mycobacteriales bacterium]|nr:response regulator [Mycobacteriales bacterium]
MSKVDILLVEDDPGDVLMTREALEAHATASTLHVVGDGEAALAFLRNEAGFAEAPRPDLVLLDLNLPRKDGHEVLAEVRGDEALRTIPVVVLTTSSAEEDVMRSYALNANAHVTKPRDYEAFISKVQAIDEFFGKVANLPLQGRSRD